MLTAEAHQKVTAAHLKRNAYLYIWQSALRQVFETSESTKRQYPLHDRAVTFGWALDRTSPLTATSANPASQPWIERASNGWSPRLVSARQVSCWTGVSRLARNSTDWHRLWRSAR